MAVALLGALLILPICVFADDSFFFFKAREDEAKVIKEVLELYEAVPGQQVNFKKSSLAFSPNISAIARVTVRASIGVSESDLGGVYLGLPSVVGRRKKEIFSFVKEKVNKRINGWNNKFLSRAGRDVLLKTMTQALPSYAMSVFYLPVELCADLEKMMNSFWWGSKGIGKRKIHWKSWQHLSISKEEGGLGFRKLHEFNLTMIAKQGWRLLSNPQSLVARVYKAQYYPRSSFIDAKIGHSPSYIWRSIMVAQHLIKAGSVYRVGDGSTIQVWKDPWLPGWRILRFPRVAKMDMKK